MLDAARIRTEYRQQKRARQLIDGADAKGDVGTSKAPPPKKRRMNALASEAGKSGKLLEKGKDHPAGTIEIQPGESLKHFNRYAFTSFGFPPPNPFLSTWNLRVPSSPSCLVCFRFFFPDI